MSDAASSEALRARELQHVGRRFLMLRPRIVAIGGIVNGLLLSRADVTSTQRITIVGFFGLALAFFFGEAWALGSRSLSARWLVSSLLLTTCAVTLGAMVSGGTASPFLPLLFAPCVVGFAAFGRARESAWLFGATAVAFFVLAVIAPLDGFGPLPAPWSSWMIGVSACVALTLLGAGVIGLVDAQTRVANALGVLREDAITRFEKHALDVDRLGAHVAHEIKNPLTAVRGLVQLVRRKTVDERDTSRLEMVEREVDRALEILEAYLRLAKPMAELEKQELPVATLFAQVCDLVEGRAQLRRVKVSWSADAVTIDADPRRLRDALLNLVLNAIAATGAGGTVDLRAHRAESALTLSVSDTGKGMTEEELAAAGDRLVSGSPDGHGLGLAIAKGIVEAHGGRLRFESEPGRGTVARMEF